MGPDHGARASARRGKRRGPFEPAGCAARDDDLAHAPFLLPLLLLQPQWPVLSSAETSVVYHTLVRLPCLSLGGL